jgi:hypothetical protein
VRAGTSRDYVILPARGTGYEVIDDRLPAVVPAASLQAVHGSPVNAEDLPDLPAAEPLPARLPRSVQHAQRARQEDASNHTWALACAGWRAKLRPGQVLTLLEQDEVTQERANRPNRGPRWLPMEYKRVIWGARAEATTTKRQEAPVAKRQPVTGVVSLTDGTPGPSRVSRPTRITTWDGTPGTGGTATAVLPGHGLLDELSNEVARYVILPSANANTAIVLWVAATHGQTALTFAPRLPVVSPEKQCGKSRLMEVIEATCNRPLTTVNISPAALVRIINEEDPPTLLLDEADAIFTARDDKSEILRGILNAGHRRGQKYIRWDIQADAPEECPTFAMAAIAAIGDLPDTIMDRGPVVRMERRAPGEQVAPWRAKRDAPALNDLRDRLHDWIAGCLEKIEAATPDLPVEDRAADNWEPLVAIADLAGGDWPQRARQAAAALTADEAERSAGESLGLRLLADIRSIFERTGKDGLPSLELCRGLVGLRDSPWSSMRRGGLDPSGLAALLKPFGIAPTKSRSLNKSGQVRGYYVDQFAAAFRRYLSSSSSPRDGE